MTDTQIENLKHEAATAGDEEMQIVCRAALSGDVTACRRVLAVINYAESNGVNFRGGVM